MMPRQKCAKSSEGGFVLVTALLIMLVLTIIGIAANRNTTTELQIAGNDKLHKQSFYDADGGTEYAAEVLEQNIACIDFFPNATGSAAIAATATTPAGIALDGNIGVATGSFQFWQNGMGTWSASPSAGIYPAEGARDMWYPVAYAAGAPHTSLSVEATIDISHGSSIIFAAGYLGLGRSSGAGGTNLDYEIYSRHIGINNSESLIRVDWRHVVGMEDPHCKYD